MKSDGSEEGNNQRKKKEKTGVGWKMEERSMEEKGIKKGRGHHTRKNRRGEDVKREGAKKATNERKGGKGNEKGEREREEWEGYEGKNIKKEKETGNQERCRR